MCHPDLPKFACKFGYQGDTSDMTKSVVDLIVIAFYHLLRVDEYTTKARGEKKTGTVQFRKKDILIFKFDVDGLLARLARNTTDEKRLLADAATMRISNKTNGIG